MAKLPLRYYPDPVLLEPCAPVTTFNDELANFAESMIETMYSSRGIGLAAPQVGIAKRVIVLDVSEEGDAPQVLVNPTITKKEGKVRSEEGCLSIPGYRDTIQRSSVISVSAQTITGEALSFDAEELEAICIQHEVDHLDGILFTDHLSRLKKTLFKRWLQKHEPLSASTPTSSKDYHDNE
jgi:peptide deformylase